MVKTLLLFFLIIFAVIGICELIFILKMLFYFPGERISSYALVILKSGCAVKQLNYIWQKLKWHGDAFATGIVAVVDNLETAEILICHKFIDKKSIVLCNMSELSQCIEKQGDFLDEWR